MKNLPFGQPGNFYKGNLHTHSTNSDGKFPMSEVISKYRDAGHDFVALSEHFMDAYDYPVSDTRDLRTDDFTTLIAAELHQGRTSIDEIWHILAVGIPTDFAAPHEGETAPQIAQRAADAGAFIGLVHPSWNGLTVEDAKTIECAHAVEVYNHGSQVEVDRGVDWPFCDQLLNGGWRLNGFATDDAHALDHDWLGGWVNVLADSLDPDALLDALKNGQYYSSQGPEIHDVTFDDESVTITSSAASSISVQGRGSKSATKMDDGMTEATFPTKKYKDAYLRITVTDEQGRRAWTNPVWFN
ncbi:MAG: PHP domain-containing protein [Rhodospirillales bacterium]|nr:PHP domain-containing protein [Rhodospirillales bacterium]